MTAFGPLTNQSIAQGQSIQPASERPGARAAESKKVSDAKARRRPEDVFESVTSETESAQAVRGAAGNEQEDAREDHLSRDPKPPPNPDEPPKRLDVNA